MSNLWYNVVMQVDKNPDKIKKLFDEISPYYDKINNFISFGMHYFIKIFSLKFLNIMPGAIILDVCCGTGDFTKIVRKIVPSAKIIGLDISSGMLKIAKKRLPKEVFMPGDCTSLPFRKAEFDYVTSGFGLRNIENRQQALCEIYRVLKNGGEFLHLDFAGKNTNFSAKVFNFFVPVFVKILGKNNNHYEYLLKSKKEYPSPEELIKEFENIGFKFESRKDFLFGLINVLIVKKV